jgi:hypothetical protein
MSTDRYYHEARLGPRYLTGEPKHCMGRVFISKLEPKHCMGRVFISKLGHIGILHVLHTSLLKLKTRSRFRLLVKVCPRASDGVQLFKREGKGLSAVAASNVFEPPHTSAKWRR